VDIDALRAQTPGCAGRIHLNNAGAGLLAQPTLDAMTAQLRREAEIGGYEAAAEAQDAIAATYDAIAGLVGGRSDEIALFDNATHAWNAAFYSVPLRSGDQILTGRAEYGSNALAYWQAARRTGAEVIVVPNDEYGQLDVAALERLAGERTKLIGVSHVPTSGGLVQPAAQIGRIARACGALYLLDATQSAGQFPVDVGAAGCDMLTGTGRKFLRGPRGSGSCGCAPRRWTGWIHLSPRSVRRPGTGTRISPGRPAPGGSPPGSTAILTSWAWALPSARPSTWVSAPSGSALSRWAPGSAASSPSCPA
jgi:selenocysteine lyase/cysteine desulfurase